MATIAFIQAKGGSGKTTAAVLVSYALARKGAGLKISLCDLDTNRGASNWLRDQPQELITTMAGVPADSDEMPLLIIDTEGRSRVEQSLEFLPPDVALFIVPCGPSLLEIEAAALAVAAIGQKRPKAGVRLLWNRVVANAINCQPEALAANAKKIGAQAFKPHLDRSTAYENARAEGWKGLKYSHRVQVEGIAIEILAFLAK